MNCSALHRQLLALERLDPPPADARDHLAGCAACRAWFQQLATVEQLAPRTKVPAPQQKAAFIQQFLAMDEGTVPETLTLPFPMASPHSGANPILVRRERAQRKTALAVALAASLALVALGIWAWQGYKPRTPETGVVGKPRETPFDVRVGARPEWKKAATARERVLVLHGVAGEIESRMETLTRTRDPQALASFENATAKAFAEDVSLCREVIEKIAFEDAAKMPLQEREREFGPIVKRLERVESLARQLANLHANPDAAASLRQLAATAHAGREELQAML